MGLYSFCRSVIKSRFDFLYVIFRIFPGSIFGCYGFFALLKIAYKTPQRNNPFALFIPVCCNRSFLVSAIVLAASNRRALKVKGAANAEIVRERSNRRALKVKVAANAEIVRERSNRRALKVKGAALS